MTTRFINHSGEICRRRIRAQDFHLRRLAVIVCMLAIFFLTNPATNAFGSKDFFKKKNISSSKSFSMEWLGIDIQVNFNTASKREWTVGTRKATNYFLFSLSKDARGVDLGVLMSQVPLCEYHGSAPSVCKWISDNACHEMSMFDSRNRPLTALRVVQLIKLTSFLLQICYKCGTLFPPAVGGFRWGFSFFPILSTLHQPIWHKDFLFLNAFIYPSFKMLDRITIAGTSTNEAAALHFYCSAFLLIFAVGSIANLIAASMTDERVRGMKGSIASALGYYCCAKPQKFILHWMDMALTSGDILFTTFAITYASCLFGFNTILGNWRMSDSISWAVGGVLGYTVCRIQLEQYDIWWWTY